jgi:hypothetical protein
LSIGLAILGETYLLAQSGEDLSRIVRNRSAVNVLVHAPLNSKMHAEIQSYVNNLAQDDWDLYFSFHDPKSAIDFGYNNFLKTRFGEPSWIIITPDGKLVAFGSTIPSYEEFEELIMSTNISKPIPRLRQFLKQYPDNIDARARLVGLLRENAHRHTKQELKITQKAMWEAKDDKQYAILPPAGFVMPDTDPFKDLELEPEKDLLIWGK